MLLAFSKGIVLRTRRSAGVACLGSENRFGKQLYPRAGQEIPCGTLGSRGRERERGELRCCKVMCCEVPKRLSLSANGEGGGRFRVLVSPIPTWVSGDFTSRRRSNGRFT